MAKKKIVSKTRRANNEGSVFQRKDGLWVGMASLGYDENGKQKRKAVYGKSKIEVVKKLSELTNRMSNDNYDYVNGNTLSGLMLDWLMVFKKPLVTARTFEGIMGKYRLYIAPKMGGMKLDEITPIIIQKFLNQMQENDLSLDYVKKTKFLLRQFFEYAEDNNMILVNPVNKVKVQSRERKNYTGEKEYKALPQEARDKFLFALNGNDFLKPLCYTMMFGGLRIGETLALTWENVDFKKGTISIEKGATNEPKFNDKGEVIDRRYIISDTKTVCSVREVPMPDILKTVLMEYKHQREEFCKDKEINLVSKSSFVFANDDGSIRSYTGTQSIFDRFIVKNNLKQYNIHFHGLRHTYSNMLFEAEQNPKLIQSLLGHRDVKTTLSTYNSIDKTYFDKATNVLNDKYKELEDKQKENEYDSLEDDELEELLENLERQKAKRKRQQDFEM